MHTNLADFVRTAAEADPDRILFRHLADGETPSEVLTAGAVHTRVSAIAAELTRLGLRGKTVLVPCPPGLGFTTAMLGAIAAGAIPVPTPPPTERGAERLVAIARSAGAERVLGGPELRAGFPSDLGWVDPAAVPDALAEQFQPYEPELDAVAYLQYTSGSTSEPRGVAITHRNVLQNCADVQEAYQFDRDSVVVSWVPAHHDLGLIYGVLMSLFVGFPSITLPAERFVERPVRWLRAISTWGGTHTVSPNFGFDLAVARIPAADRAGLDLSRWRTALNGAEPVRHATEARFAEAFAGSGFDRSAFSHSYGLSEATAKVTAERTGRRGRFVRLAADALARHEWRPADDGGVEVAGCGVPASTRIAIVDPDGGDRAGPGRIGEIWLQGPSIASGYAGDAAATATTFGAQLADAPGTWLRTGDLGYVNDGELFVTGRRKDLLLVRGENRYPQDIEWSVRAAHPALRPGAAAAFAVDDGAREQLVLVVEVYPERLTDPAPALAAIRAAAAEHGVRLDTIVLARPQAIPRTSSGKIRRSATRDAFLQGTVATVVRWDAPPEDAPAAAPSPADDLTSRVAAVVAARLGVDPADVRSARTFQELGMDSIAAVEISERLAEALGRELYPGAVQDHGSLAELVAFLTG